MNNQLPRLRVARLAAPLSAVALATMISCIDGPNTPRARDDWADAAVVAVQMHAEAKLFDASGRTRSISGPLFSDVPVRRSSAQAVQTLVRHFRHGRDSVSTVAVRMGGDGLPNFVYVFENGRIRGVVRPTYVKHAGGFRRSNARITLFDATGRVHSQTDVGEHKTASANTVGDSPLRHITRTVSDALAFIAPRSLGAEDIPESCFSLWISYTTASAALAAAAAALGTSGTGCLGTGLSCPVLGAAGLAFIVALDKWQVALDKLTTCIENSRKPLSDNPGGGTLSDISDASGTSDWADLTKTVNDFIETAIASGDYICTSDGNHCVYYGP